MSKIYKINIEKKDNEFQSITCANQKVFLHFVNAIQQVLLEEEVKTVKKAQEELNAHNIGWEEFDSKECEKAIFAIHKQNAIKEIDVLQDGYQESLLLIEKTFETPEPEEDEVLPEPDVVTGSDETQEETTAEPPASYYICENCDHEDFLREGQVKCGSCGKSIATLKKIVCKDPDCMAEMYVTENVKQCPYCKEDLYTVTERLENTGVIPTEDPVKAAEIAEKKKQELNWEYKSLEAKEENLCQITNTAVKESLDELMQVTTVTYSELVNEILDETDEKKIKALTTCKNKANSLITAITAVRTAITSLDAELTQIKQRKESVNNKIQNFQMPIPFNAPKKLEAVSNQVEEDNSGDTAAEAIAEAIAKENKEAAETSCVYGCDGIADACSSCPSMEIAETSSNSLPVPEPVLECDGMETGDCFDCPNCEKHPEEISETEEVNPALEKIVDEEIQEMIQQEQSEEIPEDAAIDFSGDWPEEVEESKTETTTAA